ncbi:MAG: galactokinase [Verrucomicrobia bacterium TMED56]|nr:MAG: galactokinase [Verrucomicrobia bacterium TMED56]
MILVRSPLRISLGGGGTDLPSYYKENEGFLIAAAINKYVFVSVMNPFTEGYILKYSEYENVNNIEDIRHPIIRETLKLGFKKNLEITTLADLPSGTGLGSSGSFTTALLKALYANSSKNLNSNELAELACDIEINKLKEPIGKQDQYIASYGGISSFNFNKDDSVDVKPLSISDDTLFDLEDNLMLFFTGYSRSASKILKDQETKSKQHDEEMLRNLNNVKKLGLESKNALESGDTKIFGELMHEHWENKKKRSGGMSNDKINSWYDIAMQNGAIGGKLVGAGGGGFLMFMSKDRNKLRKALSGAGMEEVRFNFDFEGTKTLTT